MSKGDVFDVQKTYDSFAAYFRDCCVKGDVKGAEHAKIKMKELDIALSKTEGEHV